MRLHKQASNLLCYGLVGSFLLGPCASTWAMKEASPSQQIALQSGPGDAFQLSPFDQVPNELIREILSFIRNKRETGNVKLVCTKFYEIYWKYKERLGFKQLPQTLPLQKIGDLCRLKEISTFDFQAFGQLLQPLRELLSRAPNFKALDFAYQDISDPEFDTLIGLLPQGLEKITLKGSNIDNKKAKVIAEKFKNLTGINLSDNPIGDDGATALAQNLQQVKWLDLDNTKIGETGATALAKNLPQGLTFLSFSTTPPSKAAQILTQTLPSKLEFLLLPDGNMDNAYVADLINRLPETLQVLNLNNNNMNDNMANVLAENLPRLKNLTNLLIGKSTITDAGAQAIFDKLPKGVSFVGMANNQLSEGKKETLKATAEQRKIRIIL